MIPNLIVNVSSNLWEAYKEHAEANPDPDGAEIATDDSPVAERVTSAQVNAVLAKLFVGNNGSKEERLVRLKNQTKPQESERERGPGKAISLAKQLKDMFAKADFVDFHEEAMDKARLLGVSEVFEKISNGESPTLTKTEKSAMAVLFDGIKTACSSQIRAAFRVETQAGRREATADGLLAYLRAQAERLGAAQGVIDGASLEALNWKALNCGFLIGVDSGTGYLQRNYV